MSKTGKNGTLLPSVKARKIMSSTSTQSVVERASAELSKRINGLGLRTSINSTKSSVIERVTNVFCGSSFSSSSSSMQNIDKSSKTHPSREAKASESSVNYLTSTSWKQCLNQNRLTWDQLMLDEKFLSKFFLYFSPSERCVLPRVCTRWRDILYRTPRYWTGLTPVVQCRELRTASSADKTRLYTSFLRRGFHGLCLVGAIDEDASDIANTFPMASKHIHSLSIQGSSISDKGLEILLDHLQALYELEITGCNEITEAGLWACLKPRIVSLTLSDCINIADEAVGAVAQLLPALYKFSLQAYHVTDTALGYFSSKQSNTLNVLRLQSCWEVTNHGVVNFVHALPNLTVLSLSGCSKITDDGIELIAENLQNLRSLDLSWCSRITDAALDYIACDLNQLEELILDRCVQISDTGIGYLSTMLSLQVLCLRWCTQIGDFGLQHLCGMRNLQILSLAGCSLLTSNGLSNLIQLWQLRELELTNCPSASRELFCYLRQHLPQCLVIE
ncbi:F-box/LRR-repeat protein 16-like [Agrilus planipennis]|uniref:F-box/LRR-repeat protein 16-like n=1 Tax=Agrilus planipennis TaxID=224129 RepID=A0A7F5RG47_AGRPL|nr:F-box/LRR-repeat protein 16-like [Agrilus planipennis]